MLCAGLICRQSVKRTRISNGDQLVQLAKLATMKTNSPDTRTQAGQFSDAAREHGASQSENAFEGLLRKLTKPKAQGSQG